MNEKFESSELLLRAVWPVDRRPDFWNNGRLSSAALKDKNGLSVDRTGDRSLAESIEYIRGNLNGLIISLSIKACQVVEATLRYKPSLNNPYHSEIHGSDTEPMLNDTQALFLAKQAKVEYDPNHSISIR